MWNPRWGPRNGCDGRLIAKVLIITIQVNLVPNLNETWRMQHKFTWIIVIKTFAISLHTITAAILDFTSFFTMAFLGGTHFFYSWAVFGRINILMQVCIATERPLILWNCLVGNFSPSWTLYLMIFHIIKLSTIWLLA